jgi:Ca2+/Na+ antiporter
MQFSFFQERIYSIIATILFLIAAILLIWFIIVDGHESSRLIIATVLIAVQFILFLYDVKVG